MQTRGSTNKIINKLIMQRKINNTVICLRMGKNLTAKTPPSDFQVTTPELHYYHNKQLQVKESQVPYQPTVEPLS